MATATRNRNRRRSKGRLIEMPWDQEERAFGVPEGRYLFKVTDANEGESGKGDPQIILDLIVMAPKQYKGRTQKVWFTITPSAIRFFREACEAILGRSMPKKAAEIDLDSFIGKTVYAEAQENGDWTNITNWEPFDDEDDDDDFDDGFDDDMDDEDFDDEDDDFDDEDLDDEDDDFDDDDEDEDDEPAPRTRRRRRR